MRSRLALTHAAGRSLRAIKLAHTAVWAFFAGCVVALPIFVWRGELDVALALIVVVALEVAILALNGMRCPLTSVAARYTNDRRDNFDIYLPLSIARYNKQIFGSLYVLGVLYAALEWWRSAG